jgi:hypothetical protein
MTLKQKINEIFKKNPVFDLKEFTVIDVTEDPIRPELDLEFRTSYGRKIYGLLDNTRKDSLMAFICVAFVNDIPKNVEDLDLMSRDAHLQSILRTPNVGKIAVAYTVWAKQKGGGKHILNEIYKKFKREHHIDRLITLSPLTAMAEKFHIGNGAKCLQQNATTVNYEYDITLEQWQDKFIKVKDKVLTVFQEA